MPKSCPVCGVTYPDSNIFCATDGTTLRAADTDGDLIGSVIADRYLVTDLIGEGGMGKVYLARHVRLPQQAAIKVMRPEQVRDASAIARFNREAANASRIDHDRVARVYDFGETRDGIVYLAMEFVAGRTLKAVLAEHEPMSRRRAAAVIRQIAEGLDAAHRLGIVHRDLKPDNVLLIEGEAPDGSDDRVKVVDFGIAKALGGDGVGEPGLTRTGFVVGTPEFMSPEQLLGDAVDARSDVYALAILAYQCLTGTLPFDTESADRGMTARLMTPARPLAVVRQDVSWPAGVQAVFDAGLAREPHARPASAGAFARALAAEYRRVGDGAGRGPAVGGHTGTRACTGDARGVRARAAAAVRPHARAHACSRGRSGARARRAAGAGGWCARARRGRRGASHARRPGRAGTRSLGARGVRVIDAAAGGTTTAADAGRGGPDRHEVAHAGRACRPAAGPRAAAAPSTGGHRVLDSITASLDPNNPDAQAGRAAANALRGLLPRLTNANDSGWALVRSVEANLMAGDQGRACTAMRSARAAARSDAQREAVGRFAQLVDCP